MPVLTVRHGYGEIVHALVLEPRFDERFLSEVVPFFRTQLVEQAHSWPKRELGGIKF